MGSAEAGASSTATRAGVRVVQYGNQLGGKMPPPFFSIPAWWRRFLFRVLSPRELTVYLYISSLLDKNSLAWPTQAQIANETGVSSIDTVARAIKRLVQLGFFIRNTQHVAGAQRSVYQRPAPEFTLLRLLDAKKIDNQLFPPGKESESFDDELDTTDSAVALGLQSLLGMQAYIQYVTTRDTDKESLRSALLVRFQSHTGQPYAEALAALRRADTPEETHEEEGINNMNLHDILDEAQGVQGNVTEESHQRLKTFSDRAFRALNNALILGEGFSPPETRLKPPARDEDRVVAELSSATKSKRLEITALVELWHHDGDGINLGYSGSTPVMLTVTDKATGRVAEGEVAPGVQPVSQIWDVSKDAVRLTLEQLVRDVGQAAKQKTFLDAIGS
jgi:hypothetical protein